MSTTNERVAPVQGYIAGIPWAMHLRAYDEYCKQCGPQKAMIEGHCRGGFHVSELDTFIPGWRDELDELKQLQAIINYLERRAPVAIGFRDSWGERKYWVGTGNGPVYGTTLIKAVKADMTKRGE